MEVVSYGQVLVRSFRSMSRHRNEITQPLFVKSADPIEILKKVFQWGLVGLAAAFMLVLISIVLVSGFGAIFS